MQANSAIDTTNKKIMSVTSLSSVLSVVRYWWRNITENRAKSYRERKQERIWCHWPCV